MLRKLLKTRKQRKLFKETVRMSLLLGVAMIFTYTNLIMSRSEHPYLFIAGLLSPFFLVLIMPGFFGIEEKSKNKTVIKVKNRRR